jgi:hypothetical protein
MGEKMEKIVYEDYKWVLKPQSVVTPIRVEIHLKLHCGLVEEVDVKILYISVGTQVSAGYIHASKDVPEEIMNIALDLAEQFISSLEVLEEHYSYDVYF